MSIFTVFIDLFFLFHLCDIIHCSISNGYEKMIFIKIIIGIFMIIDLVLWLKILDIVW